MSAVNIKQMQQGQNRLLLKRQKYKVELRKQELHLLFKKRRQELQTNYPPQPSPNHSHLNQINQLIATLSHQHLYPIFKEVIEMDSSLNLLFHLTAIVPQNVPAFFAAIIKNICEQSSLPNKIDLQKISEDMHLLQFPKANRIRICEQFDKWRRSQQGHTYQKIKQLLIQLTQMSQAANTALIEYVALVANASLIVMWADESLSGQMEEHGGRRKHQLNSCCTILSNILAGKQQNITQHIPLILYSTGNHIQCIGIYFNIFLIESVESSMKFEMFRIFTRLLLLNHEQVLQQHKDIVCMLANCLKLLPPLPNHQENYLEVAFRLVDMLSNLLEMLNMRYQTTQLYLSPASISTEDQDRAFVYHITIILQKLSEQKYLLCALLERKSIVRFITNHLQPQQHYLSLRTACCLANILTIITFDSFSLQTFSKQILLFDKLLRVIVKIEKNCSADTLGDKLHLLYIQKLLNTLSNCCQCCEFYPLLLNENILSVVVSLYFRLPKERKSAAREQCLYVYLNMLACSQKYMFDQQQQTQHILRSLFSTARNNNLFVQAFKSTHKPILQHALNILAYFVRVEEKSKKNQYLQSFLSNRWLDEQLEAMQQSDSQVVEQCGMKAKMLLKNRLIYSNSIDQESGYLQQL